ncbi:hypothetical protein EJ110_NYTH06553 [Nymphaea thermarum]|nr:hypothetical protein EJ110_NYTH06553 [Nymphaea thermarum]
MGSVCCIAARDKTSPHGRNTGSSVCHGYSHRNAIYSPSWSFRWDGRSHVENSLDSSVHLHRDFSLSNSRNTGGESKGGFAGDALSNGGSPMESFQTPTWPKSPVFSDAVEEFVPCGLDLRSSPSTSNKTTNEVKECAKSSTVDDTLELNAVPSLTAKNDPSSSHGPAFALTPSRKTRRSPGHPLSRQISDSRIMAFKSFESSASEGRQSFVLSVCSNDPTLGSQGGSSDGWSMRTFSELVASSQKERWSFDSENLSSNHGKITRSNSMQFSSASVETQTCGLCLKNLVDRAPWVLNGYEISTVAVLVCGHVYHAECLESTTQEPDRYDPRCPICTSSEKSHFKMSPGIALRVGLDLRGRNKLSRIAVADSDIERGAFSGPIKVSRRDGKGPKMAASSSTKGSFAKPFLKRHFSIGSRPSRSLSVNDSARRKGFWARYFKE